MNGDGIGSITFAELEAVAVDDDDGDDGVPNGIYLRRFVGR